MANLKLASSAPPPRSPERVTLASAIAARNEVERQLSAAREAVEQARDKKWQAQDKFDALRARKAEAAVSYSPGAVFAASIAAGQPCGVDVLERPSTFDSVEGALEREVATWTRTQAECNAAISGLEAGLLFKNLRVEDLARAVVRSSGVVAALLDGLDVLLAEVDQRLSALASLRARNMVSDADKDAVRTAICRPILGDHHPAVARWNEIFAALTRDPDAPLG